MRGLKYILLPSPLLSTHCHYDFSALLSALQPLRLLLNNMLYFGNQVPEMGMSALKLILRVKKRRLRSGMKAKGLMMLRVRLRIDLYYNSLNLFE